VAVAAAVVAAAVAVAAAETAEAVFARRPLMDSQNQVVIPE
jgi:hypothetical protein